MRYMATVGNATPRASRPAHNRCIDSAVLHEAMHSKEVFDQVRVVL